MNARFVRGVDPMDSMKLGKFHERQLEKAKQELKGLFDTIQKKYGGKVRVYKSVSTLGTNIQATWIPPSAPYNYGIQFDKEDGEYYFTPYKWNKPGEPFANQFYGGRKSAREAANEMIAQWGGQQLISQWGETNEAINFERGVDPKTAMKIGKASNPMKIVTIEEEYWKGGRVQSNEDVKKADENTWMNSIDDPQEINYLFQNWEKTIDPFYGFWYEDPDDPGEYIWAHPSDLEGEFIEWLGNTYYIPKTNIFKRISDEITERLHFERGLEPKRAMKVGKHRNDLFNEIKSMPFLDAMKTFSELGSDNDRKILALASHMLQVPQEEVRIAMDKDRPVYNDSRLMDEYIARQWEYGKEDTLESGSMNFDLIGSSTGEIYVKDAKTDEFLYILGAIN